METYIAKATASSRLTQKGGQDLSDATAKTVEYVNCGRRDEI